MEIILLVLESVLLVATIILLVYSIREGKQRDKLILEVGKATRVLTQQEYFLSVSDAMLDARETLIASITGRMPAEKEDIRVRQIIEKIERASRKGVTVRYLIPKFPDRLHVGHLYAKAGAEVRYSGCLMVQDLRYTVVDERLAILGVPESDGDGEATKRGYRIPSEGLSAMLEENFEKCWNESLSYDNYGAQVVQDAGASPKLLSRELHLEPDEVARLAGL